ncbi:ileal sodium/bile acid cotransporter-like [Diadema antillarum]|uniref:ileal sodium/bile acid cotransporter-like n=1 Tax=Diadema antillarum TaxID=105358 RepID=UPI003A884D8A
MQVNLGTIMLLVLAGVSSAEFNYTTLPKDFLLISNGKVDTLQVNLTGVTQPLTVEVSSSNTRIFTLDQDVFELDVVALQTIAIPVRGISLGIDAIQFTVRGSTGLIDPRFDIQPFVVKVKRNAGPINTIFTYVLLIWLMVSYVTMGVKLEWNLIRGKLKRPFGVAIGALCQFIIMPGCAALLARALRLDAPTAVALIIVGSCPGGWLSNVFTLLLDCDLILSLTMTFCSTVIALGLMPLNLFIYARPYTSGNSSIRIPFLQIFLQLITLVAPLSIGTYVAHRYPKAAKWFRRLLKPLAFILIVLGFAAGLWANYYAFASPVEVYLCAILLPVIGAVLGLLVSKMTCLSNHSAITICIETGAQNALLATSVIALSLPQPEADLMTRVPVLFVVMTFVFLLTMTGIYVIMKRYPGRYELPEHEENGKDVAVNGVEATTESSGGAITSLSARIQGIGPAKLQTKSQRKKGAPPKGMFSKSTQVDFEEVRRSNRDVSLVNYGFVADSGRSNIRRSDIVRQMRSSQSSIGTFDSLGRPDGVDVRNPAARQVYL